uniref:Transcriptional regulator n=1 Tax=Bellilinea caldifistulae TaxID=360411 RepID=A0A7C4KY98_9CHLR
MKKSHFRAIEIFKKNNNILRSQQAIKAGISPRTLYELVESGHLIRITRGLYQLASAEPFSIPDIIPVILKIPKAVLCAVSALNYYGLTTQIPHQIDIALPQKAEKPRMDYPPLRIFWLSQKTYLAGITEEKTDLIRFKIYNREKTVCDCFKFRNRIGIDVAVEALQLYLRTPARNIPSLLDYAKIDRVENLIKPYIQALV